MSDDVNCEKCRYSKEMYLSPASDRMLCERHKIDVMRNHRCRDFKEKKKK
jgi:hypothetical protein